MKSDGSASPLQRLLRALSATTSDYIIAIDSGGTIIFADDEVLRFLGRAMQDLGKFTVEEVLYGADLAWVARVIGRMSAGAPVSMPQQVHIARKGKGVKTFSIFVWKHVAPDGEVAFVGLIDPQVVP